MNKVEEKFKAEVAAFKEAVQKMQMEMVPHLETAQKELEAAVKVAEKYSLPFHFPISFLSQSYTPRSFEKKWGKVYAKISDICEDYDEEKHSKVVDDEVLDLMEEVFPGEHSGWDHSMVCG